MLRFGARLLAGFALFRRHPPLMTALTFGYLLTVIVDNLMKLRPGAPVAPHAPGVQPAAPAAGKEGATPASKS